MSLAQALNKHCSAQAAVDAVGCRLSVSHIAGSQQQPIVVGTCSEGITDAILNACSACSHGVPRCSVNPAIHLLVTAVLQARLLR